MRTRSNNWRLIVLFGIGFIIAVGIGWLAAKKSADLPVSPGEDWTAPAETGAKVVAHLYFGDPRGAHLMAEQRVFTRPNDEAAFGRSLVQALIEGPRQRGSRTLPKEATLRAFFLVGGGTANADEAVVDFDAQAFATHPKGIDSELLSIYSIVNTLVFNMDSVRKVKILIGGREAATLTGHVDLSHPFAADMLWVR